MPDAVRPSPIPTTFQVAMVTVNETGQKFTMLTVMTAVGQSVFFLDSDTAKAVGDTLLKSSSETKGSGLVVAQAVPK